MTTNAYPLPPLDDDERRLLDEAIETFNGGGHYEAHDLFEELWGPEVFKGFVQAAVALHHHKIRNAAGLDGLPESVDRILARAPADAYGMDVARFRADMAAFLAEHPVGAGGDAMPRIHRLDA